MIGQELGDEILTAIIVLGIIAVIVLMALAALNWVYLKVNIHG